jgi:hypothetical protein
MFRLFCLYTDEVFTGFHAKCFGQQASPLQTTDPQYVGSHWYCESHSPSRRFEAQPIYANQSETDYGNYEGQTNLHV